MVRHTSGLRQRREDLRRKIDTDLTLNRRPPQDSWGDKMKKKKDKTVRICMVNVNGIGSHARSAKSEDLRRFIVEQRVDVMGICELGVNWGRVHAAHTFWDRTKRWVDTRRVSVAYNSRDILSRRAQPGGTATLVVDDVAHRYKGSGFDTTGLGRWSWIVITGKQQCVTRIVTAYCPVKSTKGLNTVYAQQLAYFKTDPVSKFWDDLATEVAQWHAAGEQIILMGDWNEPVNSDNLRRWCTVLGLKEGVSSKHSGDPPPTYHRGRFAIDGIFVSTTLQIDRSGYLPFGELPGDHRGIWMDVSQSQILGYKMADIPTAKARKLKLQDPRVVQKYLDELHSYFVQHKVYRKLKVLQASWDPGVPLTAAQAKEYEDIDNLRAKGMLYAEQHCRKFRTGKIPWSPALQHARNTITFWVLIRRRLKGCKVGARRVIRLKKKLGIKGNTHLPLPEVDKKIAKAYKKYRVCKTHASELRLNHQESLAQAMAAAGNKTATQALRDLQQREKMRNTYSRIRYTLKKRQSGTTKIQVQDGESGYKEITKKREMEKYIIAENESKFHQTERRCPLLHGQLYRDLGLIGDGPRVKDVLAGTYEPPPGTSEVVRSWLGRMKIRDPDRIEDIMTSFEDFQKGWKLVAEQTASGNLHMGHFKAGSTHPDIGKVHYLLSMIPMTTGYSPTRWQQGIDVMLLKSPEVYLLSKLRTIVLYEADFNHENKRLGRDSIQKALAADMIAEEQFSRPGRSAQDNALCKRLVFDYFRLRKRPFAMCACDLKSCYDRVVHTAASLALQRVGVPLAQIRCMFSTIQLLVHKIRTAFGLSKRSFGGASRRFLRPPQGMGQGNGAGPSIWSILSSTVFEELRAKGFSTDFCYALSTGLYRLCGFSYVDDCDLIADGDTVDEVYTKLQAMLELWDHLMEVNGAAIAPDKCWWYMVDFVWKDGKWSYRDAGEAKVVEVRDKDNEIWQLKYLRCSKAKEMVGVYLAPKGNQNDQIKALRDKTTEWRDYICRSPLDDIAIWTALTQTISKGVEYPLAATTLSEEQVSRIMVPARSCALPRAKITRSFPHAVLYGPVELQGLGLQDLFVYQYCRHVQDIVDQHWRQTPTGSLLLANIEAVKVEAGLYDSLFDQDLEVTWFNTWNSWVIETYRFCRKHDIVFSEPGTSLLPQCQEDNTLMDEFFRAGFSSKELTVLNRCRLFCRVTSISDVAEGDGLHLSPRWFRYGEQNQRSSISWPQQGLPSRRDWSLWSLALNTALCRERSLRLKTPLGMWILTEDQLHNWEWFTSNGLLYQHTEGQWLLYPDRHHTRTRHTRYTRATRLVPRPVNVQRTTVQVCNEYIEVFGSRSHRDPQVPTQEDDIESAIRVSLDADWFATTVEFFPSQACVQGWDNDNVTAVSDGSYRPEDDVCSCAWIIRFGHDAEISGGGPVPSAPETSSAFRGELAGLLAQLRVVYACESQIGRSSRHPIQIGCDGKSALFKSLCTTREYFSSRHQSFDLISRIIALREKIQSTLVPVHVRGHQDERGRILTTLEEMNVQMDLKAKSILEAVLENNGEIPDALPIDKDALIQVDYKDIPISSQLAYTLHHRICRDRIVKWWEYKGRFREDVYTLDIDWTVMARCMKESSFRMRRFVSKWVSHHIAVGRMMGLREARLVNSCPRCGCAHENTLHVLRCHARSSRQQWKKEVRKVKKWLVEVGTDPEITRALEEVLRNYNRNHDFDTYTSSVPPPHVQACLESQTRIGWTGFMEGLFAHEWSIQQSEYYLTQGSRRSGNRWAVELSKRLWKMIFAMWDHRNRAIFETEKAEAMSGLVPLKAAISRELEIGPRGLDPSFQPYFTITSETFSKMSPLSLRRWFALIRQARKDSGYLYQDDFKRSQALRDWVGLTKSPSDPTLTPAEVTRRRRRRQQVETRQLRTGYQD